MSLPLTEELAAEFQRYGLDQEPHEYTHLLRRDLPTHTPGALAKSAPIGEDEPFWKVAKRLCDHAAEATGFLCLMGAVVVILLFLAASFFQEMLK